MLLVLKRLG